MSNIFLNRIIYFYSFLNLILPKSNLEIRNKLLENSKKFSKRINSEVITNDMSKVDQMLSQVFEKELDYVRNLESARALFLHCNSIEINELFCLIDEERKGFFSYEK